MNYFKKSNFGLGISILIILLVILITAGIDFLITCGFVKLICLCFKISISFKETVGIWLIVLLARSIISCAKSSSSK